MAVSDSSGKPNFNSSGVNGGVNGGVKLQSLPNNSDHVAVVGMACRLPGDVTNPNKLWEFLSQKRTGWREFGPDRINLDGYYHPNHQRPASINTRGGYLLNEDPRLFDQSFFGMNPVEVMTMDPMQRKLLECAYEALENAGEPWEKFSGSRTGVFVGNFNTDYHVTSMYDIDFSLPYQSTGGSPGIMSNRINHLLNLKGPSLTVDTACSSSLYALHLAVTAIRNGDCDAAIVGGSNLILSPEMQMLTCKLGALSPTSICHTFDASADGYARGEGFGALYLRRYKDAVDGKYPVRAVIRSTAINANGKTAGISHPSSDGQEALIRQAYKNAGIATSQTGYFECHGTGTPVGDPIEVAALARVFAPERGDSKLLIGSVKTNFGHAEAASGISGVMKSILAMENGIIPPTIGVEQLNPSIDFEAAKVQIVTELTPWPEGMLRRVSVNSFGYGGANAHIILEHPDTYLQVEQAKAGDGKVSQNGMYNGFSNGFANGLPNGSSNASTKDPSNRYSNGYTNGYDSERTSGEDIAIPSIPRLVLLPISGHDETALKRYIAALGDAILELPLDEVAYTLSCRRSKFLHKTFRIIDSSSPSDSFDIRQPISSVPPRLSGCRLGFVFTGQGAQWKGMGSTLFEYETFRESIRRQDTVLQALSNKPSWHLKDALTVASSVSVQNPGVSQTVCTALQIGIVDLLARWNIKPHATVGHSSGEIAAAYASGSLTLPEAIVTAYCRGLAVSTNPREGLMVATGLSESDVRPYLQGVEDQVKVAAINSPGSVTLSGDIEPLTVVKESLEKNAVFARALHTGGNAYHSHHMAALGEGYELLLKNALLEVERFIHSEDTERLSMAHWISSVTPSKSVLGTSIEPSYWRKNLESPVQFLSAVENLVQLKDNSIDLLIEIGPHSALQSPLKQIFAKVESEKNISCPLYLPSIKRFEDSALNILTLCGALFNMNYPVDLVAINSVEIIRHGSTQQVHGSVCTKLPTYPYTYGTPICNENRIGREIRERKHLRHDALGVLQPGCAEERPSWRNILRVKDIPWLSDHRLIPNVVLPASAYVSIAIEAASQIRGIKDNACFKLRNVFIGAAMQIPEDERGLEIITNLTVSSNSESWDDFKVSSVSADGTWTNHASGQISIVSYSRLPQLSRIDKSMAKRTIEVNNWYEKFAEVGLGYGKSFRAMSDLVSDPYKNIARANVNLHTTKGMFNGPESKYVIHPASLDICHQLALIACHGGQTGRVSHAFVPVHINEMSIWPAKTEEDWGVAMATGQLKGLRAAHGKIQLFTQNGLPRLEINDIRVVSYVGGSVVENSTPVDKYMRLVWKPDISALTFNQAKTLFPPTGSGQNIAPIFRKMDETAMHMIIELAERYSNRTCENVHLQRFLGWIRRAASKQFPYSVQAHSLTSIERLQTIESLCKSMEHIIDVKIVKRLFDNMDDILTGSKTGVEIALQGGMLTELYSSGVGIAEAYHQFDRVLDLLGHQSPDMKIIEIGAGTGGATRIALKALNADTNMKRYGTYSLTDISSAFLEVARSEFVAYNDLSFSTLDINRCPNEQGFEAEYDVVVACNCLHVTTDIAVTLQNVRKLLKPGGKLILLEITRVILGHGLAFGTFPDYFGNEERDSPFVDSKQWAQTLEHTGFSGIDIELDDYEGPLRMVSTIVSTAVEPLTQPEFPKEATVYVLHEDTHPVFLDSLGSAMRSRRIQPIFGGVGTLEIPEGARVILVMGSGCRFIADGSEAQFHQLRHIVWKSFSILCITVGGILAGHDPTAAIPTGLFRMLTTETPESNYGLFHLDPDFDPSNLRLATLIIEREERLFQGDFEREAAMHKNILHLARLLPDSDMNSRYQLLNSSDKTKVMKIHEQGSMVADFASPGLLSSLFFKKDVLNDQSPLPSDFIEIKTGAVGLNWKDLAICSGKIDMDNFSAECAGTVLKCGEAVRNLKPGDRVYAMAWSKYSTHIRFPAVMAQVMAPTDNMADMASVPMIFSTAVYALNHLGRLQKGEKVLIQSASGGVGSAAIQIAQHIEADIFVTVGSDDKAQYLTDNFQIPKNRIFSSRSLEDLPGLLAATGGKGFDVILSSSNGDAMHESWRLIAPRGRFIDVGRVDVQNHKLLAMEAFARNATFSSFDMSIMAAQDTDFCSKLMAEVGDLFRAKFIRPLPRITLFDISELEQGLLYFSQGKHVGKIVITYEDPDSVVKMNLPVSRAQFDPGATYILVGGLGGLGKSILQWMVERGARYFAVWSRSGMMDAEAARMVQELTQQGVCIEPRRCDVTNKADVNNTISLLAAQRPVKGILHAAVAFCDQVFENLEYEQWKLGMAAKVIGTVNLHEASIENNLALDFFVMTSSFQSVLALPTQSSYCAANNFQDAFARYRRSIGLPACSIGLGLITELGGVGEEAITRGIIARNNLYLNGELDFLQTLEAAFLPSLNTAANWKAFDPLAEAQITTSLEPIRLAKVLASRPEGAPMARWYGDKKFSHIAHAMQNYLSSKATVQRAKGATSVLTSNVDAAIKSGMREDAIEMVVKAIMERTAALLLIPVDNIEPSKSVAAYGVDSLIAVELRSWCVTIFETTIPLLKLLDENMAMYNLAEWIVGEKGSASTA